MPALTFDDLLKQLFSAADPEYLRPFFQEGGYNNGREAFEALIEVLRRVDEAIVRTTSAMYLLPWSGQDAPPATGGFPARLTLRFRRNARLELPLVVVAGAVRFQEVERDWGPGGGVEVVTGREYVLEAPVVLQPGETGPVDAPAVCTLLGYGGANPQPGTIRRAAQPGDAAQNFGASVVQTPSVARLVVRAVAPVVVPEHVGQYVAFLGGANAGQVRRVVGYEPADALAPHGGVALLAATFCGRSLATPPTGTFQVGETVTQTDSVGPTVIAQGVVLGVSSAAPWYVVVDTTAGAFAPTAGTVGPIVGTMSGATFTVEDVTQQGQLVPEAGTAVWAVQPWHLALGLQVENPAGLPQVPGAYPMLDALGGERGVYRSPGEGDESYRQRAAQMVDMVTPNAVRRTGNRIWAPHGGSVCLREVGQPKLQGLYCDTPPGDPSDLAKHAYDLDALRMRGVKVGEFFDGERVYQDNVGVLTTARVTTTIAGAPPGSPVPAVDPLYLEVARVRGPRFVVGVPIVGEVSGATFTPNAVLLGLRPQDRFKLDLDYTDFRAFFLVGVPKSGLGEVGIPYDEPHPYNAFDASPWLTFSDGFPLTTAVLNRATWQAVDRVRAGGVGFDLYAEDQGCQ